MKVFHIIPKIKSGGVETAVLSSIEKINLNHDMKVISIEKTDKKTLLKKTLCFNSYIYNPILYIKFIWFIYKERPDVIVFSLWKSNLLGLLTLPIIRLFHSKVKTATIIHNARYAHFMDKFVTKLSVKRVNKLFFDSKISKDFTEKNSARSGIVLSFKIKDIEKKERGVNSSHFSFVFTGRISKVKNVDRAIFFIYALKSTGRDASFDIYGPDEGCWSDCLQLIKKLNLQDCVKYHGVAENDVIQKKLKNYDYYLQLSSNEGMAMSVVDAMQTGLVPCVTRVGQIQVYAENGSNAFLFDHERIHVDEYLSARANDFINLFNNEDYYNHLSFKAAQTFITDSLYADDFESKLINCFRC